MAFLEESRGNSYTKKALIVHAKEIAEKSLKLDDTNPQVHIWYALSIGKMGDYQGPRDRLNGGIIYKKHIEKAIELSPNDPFPHYLIGRFMYELSQLSWWERRAASLIGTIPEATVDEALEEFLKAEDLYENLWIENELYIAKAYIAKRDCSEANKYLDKAFQAPIINSQVIFLKKLIIFL